MARKTHVIGFRLGVGEWWKTRTPPQQEKERGIEQLVRGVMERFGYLTSEVVVQKGQGKGAISLLGGRGKRIEMYLLEFLREIVKKSEKAEYRISYREEKEVERNGAMKYREMVKSPRRILVRVRRKKNESRSYRK